MATLKDRADLLSVLRPHEQRQPGITGRILAVAEALEPEHLLALAREVGFEGSYEEVVTLRTSFIDWLQSVGVHRIEAANERPCYAFSCSRSGPGALHRILRQSIKEVTHLCGELLEGEWLADELHSGIEATVVHDGVT
jgi:hypothetical protein